MIMQHITTEDFHLTNTAIALGKFEGIHLGHQLLLDRIVHLKKFHFKSVVFTFDRPPSRLFGKESSPDLIYTRAERRKILEKMGIDVVVEHPFTKEFAAMTPESFVKNTLVGKLGARKIIVGKDFRFGRNRSGNVDTLRYLAEDCDYELIVFDKLKKDGKVISSTGVREALLAGNIEEARSLLGRPYTISGEIIHGKGLGSSTLFPSANLALDPEKCVTPRGVYLTTAEIDGKSVCGVTNIGVRPTVDNSETINAETYFLDYQGDLYGREIELSLHNFVRPEMKFESLDALKAQMEQDIEYAAAYYDKKDAE